jgi:hypothetical protein
MNAKKGSHRDASFHYIETAAAREKAILFPSPLCCGSILAPSETIHELFATRIFRGKRAHRNVNCTIAVALARFRAIR